MTNIMYGGGGQPHHSVPFKIAPKTVFLGVKMAFSYHQGRGEEGGTMTWVSESFIEIEKLTFSKSCPYAERIFF